jgi:hypothetical protein
MRHSAWSRLALELSIEHSAGEDGYRSVAAEGQGQHPKRKAQNEGAKPGHGKLDPMKHEHDEAQAMT